MSYAISLKHGFDTKEMVENRVNRDLVYVANKLALAIEFESEGSIEAAEKAAMKGIKMLIKVADDPGIRKSEKGYVSDLFGTMPDRFAGMALDEMRRYINSKSIPVITGLLSKEYDIMSDGEVYSKHPWNNLLRRDIHYDFPDRR